jgi:hypothetical protein
MIRWPLVVLLAMDFAMAALFAVAFGLPRPWRRLAMAAITLAILLSPLLIVPERRFGRLLVAVFAVALCVKLHDVHVGIERGYRPGAWSFLVFLPNLAALVLRKVDREPRPSSRECFERLARLVPAFLAGTLLLIGAFRVDWRPWPFAVEHCVKVVSFFLMLVPGARAATTILMLLGLRARDPMTNPFAARTPADFWKRYNRPAQQFLYEHVFKPSGGRRFPLRGVMITFFVSAIIHEYVFDMAVGRVQGYQAAFFAIQGVAVAATLRVRPDGWRAFPWVSGTFAFNLATGVLFFASVGEVLPFYASRAPGSCSSSGVVGPRLGDGLLKGLPAEQPTFHARRREGNAEQLDDVGRSELPDLIERGPLDAVGQERRRGLADDAAVAVETDFTNPSVVAHTQLEMDLVATERVVQLHHAVGGVEVAAVRRGVVMVEDLLAVQGVIHSRAPSRPGCRFAASSDWDFVAGRAS